MRVPPAIAALPRFAILDGPSPLARLSRFSAALGPDADIWIKREDLLPLAFGGNKLRNLEFLVGAALAGGADSLITSGRRWSNHCRLTAAAGARAGLSVHLALTGPPAAAGREGANQLLDEILGATVHITATADRAERAALVESIAAAERAAGRRPFVIGVGGTGAIGAAGQVLAGLELADQLRAAGVGEATIVLPSATGGTQAGLLAGLGLGAPPAHRVIGIAVASPAADLRRAIDDVLAGLVPLAGWRVEPEAVVLEDDQLGAGYGRPSEGAGEAARLLARTEGILVDPIYTAKALAGLVARVRDGRLSGPVVFWHAGGTTGLFERLSVAD
ncbi:MAG: D-cysteine desulfhydrase [Chloroflexota bacterium]|jgi:1-aminocyclopropane-1-carboxylate deaminase/D-cysteine desulfhydrase-like pyridoxal-dependent ACC family enzyme|nr:D-cysteine desulfhydrase [Chloroflexota bacterium]